MLAAARAELLVLRKWPVARALLLVTPVVMLATLYVMEFLTYLTLTPAEYASYGTPSQNLPSLLPSQFSIISVSQFTFTAQIPLIVLGALMAGGGWTSGTLRTALLQRQARATAFGGQAIALCVAAVGSTVLTFAVAAAASLAILGLESSVATPVAAAMPPALAIAESLGAAVFIALAYSVIGLALGTICRNAVGAMAIGLVWTLMIDTNFYTYGLIASGPMRTIGDLAPGPSAATLSGLFGTPGGGALSQNYLPVSVPEAVWTLSGYVVGAIAVCVVLLRRRDITSGRSRRRHRGAGVPAASGRVRAPARDPAPAGLLATVRAELLIMRGRPAVWGLVLILPAQMLVTYYLTQYVEYLTVNDPVTQGWGLNAPELLTALSPGQYLTGALSSFGVSSGLDGVYGATVFMLLGALIGGSDWGLRTIKVVMTQGAGRLRTVFGQYLAIAIALAATVLVTFAAAAAASAIAAVSHAGSLSALTGGFPAPGQAGSALAAGLVMGLAYGAIGVTLGVLFRSAAGGIGAAMVWAVVLVPSLEFISNQLHGVLLRVYDALPDASTNALANLPNHSGLLFGYPIDETEVAPPAAFVILGLYALVFLAVPAVVTWRRDIA